MTSKLAAPLTITLYGTVDGVPDSPLGTYSRTRVPVDILLQAIDLAESYGDIDEANIAPAAVKEMMTSLGAFVVEVFGGQFTLSELLKGVEMNDLLLVVKNTAARAANIAKENPTPASIPTRSGRRR